MLEQQQQSYPAAPITPKPNLLYGIPIIGGFFAIAGVFLPWVSFAVVSGFISLEGAINGFGGCSGSPILCNSFNRGSNFSPVDAIVIAILAVLALVVGGIGLLSKMHENIWLLGAICGVICGGIAVSDLLSIMSRVQSVNSSSSQSSGDSVSSAAQTGIGLYLIVVGAVVSLGGFILVRYKRYPAD
jgi:hypothetical protein